MKSRVDRLEQRSAELKQATNSLVQEVDSLNLSDYEAGLEKTRGQFFTKLQGVFGSSVKLREEDLESLEELLLTSDLGVATTNTLLSQIKAKSKENGGMSKADLSGLISSQLNEILNEDSFSFNFEHQPLVLFVVGVNGVGKTTTIGKLAHKFVAEDKKVLLGACDTFRAAAASQLSVWAGRSDVAIEMSESEEKPSTVAFRAVKRAQEENFDVLIIDTAGRLHTKQNLMKELESVRNLITRELPGAPHEVLLVLDASTGQNALQQAKEFNDSVDLTGLVITKLDGTPKGGIVVAIKQELGIPIRFVGVGEGVEDLKNFNSEAFVSALLQEPEINFSDTSEIPSSSIVKEEVSAHAKVRRKRQRKALS